LNILQKNLLIRAYRRKDFKGKVSTGERADYQAYATSLKIKPSLEQRFKQELI